MPLRWGATRRVAAGGDACLAKPWISRRDGHDDSISGFEELRRLIIRPVISATEPSTKQAKRKAQVTLAGIEDVPQCKEIANRHRGEIGFLPSAVFLDAAKNGRLLILKNAENRVLGFLRFNHRVRGNESALYDVCVESNSQRQGLGRLLVLEFIEKCRVVGRTSIVLRCPENLPANVFYLQLGFVQSEIYDGKRRRLIVWRMSLESPR